MDDVAKEIARELGEEAKELASEAKEVTLGAAEVIALAPGVGFAGVALGALLLVLAII